MDATTLPAEHSGESRAYAALLRSVPAYTFATNADGDLIYLNEEWGTLLGLSAEDLARPTWAKLLHHEDHEYVLRQWAEALEKQSPLASVHRFDSPSGPIWMSVEARPVRLEDSQFVGHSGCAQRIATAAVGESSLKVRTLAHDLNNVLTIIAGLLEIGLESAELGDEGERDLREALSRACELTNELLGGEGVRVPVALNEFVTKIASTYRASIGGGVHLNLELDPTLQVVSVYSTILWRALANLILNAGDAMSGGGELTIKTKRIETIDGRGFIRISVRNTGPEISAANLKKIFEPNFSTKALDHGGGLGLAVVDACARLHAGQVEVETGEGAGTAFHLELAFED